MHTYALKQILIFHLFLFTWNLEWQRQRQREKRSSTHCFRPQMAAVVRGRSNQSQELSLGLPPACRSPCTWCIFCYLQAYYQETGSILQYQGLTKVLLHGTQHLRQSLNMVQCLPFYFWLVKFVHIYGVSWYFNISIHCVMFKSR